MSTRARTFFVITALAFGYAILRYHVLKGTPWSDFPLFISNKAISLAALSFIALSYALGALAKFWPSFFERTLSSRKFFGLVGFGLGAVHALISTLIFSPEYYPKYYAANGALNFGGEVALLFGIVSFALFSIVAVTSIPSIMESLGIERWLTFQRLGYWGLAATLVHVAAVSWKGWLDMAGWPGGLLPISLMAFSIALLVLLLRALSLFVPAKK